MPDYVNSLKSLYWRDLKIKVWQQRANKRCEICRFRAGRLSDFALHHRHYNSVGRESERDVLLLCKRCHKKLHVKAQTLDKQRLEGAYRWLLRRSNQENGGKKNTKAIKHPHRKVRNKQVVKKRYGILGKIQAKKDGLI